MIARISSGLGANLVLCGSSPTVAFRSSSLSTLLIKVGSETGKLMKRKEKKRKRKGYTGTVSNSLKQAEKKGQEKRSCSRKALTRDPDRHNDKDRLLDQ